jgi:hypothetical protein
VSCFGFFHPRKSREKYNEKTKRPEVSCGMDAAYLVILIWNSNNSRRTYCPSVI